MWLLAAGTACAVYALVLAIGGGFDVQIGAIRVRSHEWARPAIVSVLAAALLSWIERARLAELSGPAWRVMSSAAAARTLTLAALAWTLAASLTFGTFAIGGSDSFGYVSQARLLAHGHLTDVIPVDPRFSWPDVEATLTPLAFKHGTSAGVMAPTYPPGLPLLMAPLTAAPNLVYLVVPFFGLLAVWLTYRMGVAMGQPLAGAAAAVLLSLSPTFLFQVLQPMSDVPVTACWLGVLLLASRDSGRTAAAAGAVASLAILIRPNLAPLACVPLMAVALHRPVRWGNAAVFALSALPGVVALGWIQDVRYGSPFASGYLPLREMFATGNVGPNLARYPRWLTETHTWFIWLWVAAPFWIGRLTTGRRIAWTALAFCVGVWAAYLPYFYFKAHEWMFTRFLLPVIPIMLLFAAVAALRAVGLLPVASRALAAGALLAIAAFGLIQSARAHGPFGVWRQESKYPAAGAFVREHLPGSAVVLAMQHSGSVRYYADRPTLRWDILDPSRLDEVLRILRANGFSPYAVIDAGEDEVFRRRFGEAGQQAVRHLLPLAVFGDARVYAFE